MRAACLAPPHGANPPCTPGRLSLQPLTLQAGQRLCRQGATPPGTLYLVRHGILRLERVTAHGERHIVGLVGRHTYIGLEALLRQPHADEVVACTVARVLKVPCCRPHEWLAQRLAPHGTPLQRWRHALPNSRAPLTELTRGAARRRVLLLLCELARLTDPGRDPSVVWLPRRDDIADLLDITIETACRQLSALRREGVLVDVGRGCATLDAARLALAVAALA